MHIATECNERAAAVDWAVHGVGDPIVVNPSRDDEYHTQRNNAMIPHDACNVTAYVMAAKQAGCSVPSPHGVQPEDHMMGLLQTDEAYSVMKRSHDWATDSTGKPRHRPNEVHDMLVWAFNGWSPNGRAEFTDKGSIREMVYHIVKGNGVVTSGRFPLSTGRVLGHVVTVAGFITTQRDIHDIARPDHVELSQLSAMIIDDPYGDYRSDYRNHRGNNIEMSLNEFHRIIRNQDQPRKWMHVISWVRRDSQ